jgi:hypothetical protein
MDAERIVRALATTDPADYDTHECRLCGNVSWNSDGPEQQVRALLHKPDCPWRLARAWVAAHPT